MSSLLTAALIMTALCAVVVAGTIFCFCLPTGEHANPKGAAVTVASLYAARKHGPEITKTWPDARGHLPGDHDVPSWWPALVRPYVREGPAPRRGSGPFDSS